MSLRANQAEARATRVGASEVSALMGTSKYHTPRDVYRRIVYGEQREANEAMRLGSLVEDRNIFQTALRWRGMVTRRSHHAYVHATLPLSASPDLYANPWMQYPRGLVECKLSSAKVMDGHVPEWWVDQLTVQLGLAQREHGYLVVLNGSRLTVSPLAFDEARYASIEEQVARFDAEHLRPRIEPQEAPFTIILQPKELKP